MLNSWEGRKQPLMGFKWYPTFKRGLHSEMGGFMTTITFPATAAAAAGGSKCFNNPNFVNRNNPSLLKHQDFYVTHQAELVKIPNDPTPPPQKQEMSKRKRKRKRKNKKKNKQSADLKKTESPPIPELTKSFKCISVGPSRKTRLPSVCESEDSFIVFDETDGVDESTEVSETEGLSSSDSCIPHKKVRFAEDKKLCEVHPMVQWSYAYQAARKGPWQEYARDRERFFNRIRETEKTLSSILNPRHREKIYQQRFCL